MIQPCNWSEENRKWNQENAYVPRTHDKGDAVIKRIEMREHTRRAVSDVCGILMSEFGIVASFNQVVRIAQVIDAEMLRFGQCVIPMTPDEWQKEQKRGVTTHQIGDVT